MVKDLLPTFIEKSDKLNSKSVKFLEKYESWKSKELLVGLTVLSMPGERQRLEFHKNWECMYPKIEWKNIYAPKTPIMSQRDQQ